MCNVGLNNLLIQMENKELEKLYDIFSRYGAYPKIELKTETRDLDFSGTAMQYQFVMDTRVSMDVEFKRISSFTHFVNDLNRLDELYDEEYLRRHNPALQRAWEEYQIILKLTR